MHRWLPCTLGVEIRVTVGFGGLAVSELRNECAADPGINRHGERRRAYMLALLVLIAIIAILFGRSLITVMRPHLDEEQDVARQQLEEDITGAIQLIDDNVKMAVSARIGGENNRLSVWKVCQKSSGELLPEESLERIDFYVDEDKNLVANLEPQGAPDVLVERVENIVFHLIDPGSVGLIIKAERDGELVEVRHLIVLGEKVSE